MLHLLVQVRVPTWTVCGVASRVVAADVLLTRAADTCCGSGATDGAFAAAAEVARGLQQLSQQQKLRLYALYKQSTVGDAPQVSPAGRFDPTAQYKWKAWAGLRGVAQPAAKRQYAHAVGELVAAQSGGQASPAAAASPDNASTLGSS